jgi:hypothetical protein
MDSWESAVEKQSSANQTQIAIWLEAATSSTHALSQSAWRVKRQQAGVIAHVDYAPCVGMLSSHFVWESRRPIARYILQLPSLLVEVIPRDLWRYHPYYIKSFTFTSRTPVNMRFAFVFSVLMPALAFALPAATNGDNTQVEARQVTLFSR